MIVDHLVRAILINNLNQLILARFLKGGTTRYLHAPGGGVEMSDGGFEQALERCIRTQIGGSIEILKLVFQMENQLEEQRYAQQHFYLCRLTKVQPDYEAALQGVPLRQNELQSIEIQPPLFKRFLLDQCDRLFELPDLRQNA